MTLTMFVTLYSIGIFFIGVPMAIKSYRVWKEAGPHGHSTSVWGYLLFPKSACLKQMGRKDVPFSLLGKWLMPSRKNVSILTYRREDEFRLRYILLTSIIWLPKIIVNVVIWTLVLILTIVVVIVLYTSSYLGSCLDRSEKEG